MKQIDKFGCVGNTIKTASGEYLDLLNPDPESINLQTIAAALSKICRFGGHCPQFYSVAEHCVHATRLALDHGARGEALIAILMHDAAEAYIGDCVKPLKNLLPEYRVIEARIERAIELAFNIDFARYRDVVKRFDRLMLKSEKIAMWPSDSAEWTDFVGIESADVTFRFLMPDKAEAWFLDTANSIYI